MLPNILGFAAELLWATKMSTPKTSIIRITVIVALLIGCKAELSETAKTEQPNTTD
jgi:hypothetical protein